MRCGSRRRTTSRRPGCRSRCRSCARISDAADDRAVQSGSRYAHSQCAVGRPGGPVRLQGPAAAGREAAMSYLHLAEGIPDFSKAVISLWFRAPKASVQAVANAQGLDAGIEGFFMLQQILPLITFGQPQVSKTYSTPTRNVAGIQPYLPGEPDPATTYVTGYYVEGGAYGVDPSHIGLFCQSDGTIRIQVILQMGDHMPLGATTFITTQMDIYSG